MLNNKRLNGYLDGVYTLLAPLSHIGESHGPDSYLATQDIIGPDGMPVEVFVYSGNAIRGMLRDCGSKYFLDKLSSGSILQIPLQMFYFLFSGGSIGGDQSIDIDQARKIRETMPIASIFGGGVGNQILPGKLCVNDAWPIAKECAHFIPKEYLTDELISWRQMTTERSYTRTDDAKDERKREYIFDENIKAIEGGQMKLLDTTDENKKKKKEDAPIQMRYTVEVLQAGSRLYHRIDVRDLTEIEMGALVSAIVEWSKSPYIGGQARIGMGRAMVEYHWHPVNGETESFIEISDGLLLGDTARETKAKYDEYLGKYVKYLESHKESLVKMLEA